MTNRKKRLYLALALNLLIAALELAGGLLSFRGHGFGALQFYTEDSNLLNLAACLVFAVCCAHALIDPRRELPYFAVLLKYTAVCCLMITFLVVVFVLAPMYSGEGGLRMLLFSDSMLYNHFICPLLTLACFLFADPGPAPKKSAPLFSLIPTVLYAAVAVTLNITRVMHGPYPFLYVYEQTAYMSVIWAVVIFAGAYIIALLLYGACRLIRKKDGLANEQQ